ncbi:leucine rich repeat protein [Naegleria gruberi]|uniref:Leucine rich repeat protein n=1 Tax=Naegleria gruberi TaxID=5762 RepID=D2V9K8_NAEGR|nr:leucine rich repeat protein [Naegleria gruberi]EFC46606.1 leucine rich repeat protein [Naegleria gruberi]|eukprot:XP_002679350.1 leucine rich repeat protein [Naegleria gruberi strain NEG-M]
MKRKRTFDSIISKLKKIKNQNHLKLLLDQQYISDSKEELEYNIDFLSSDMTFEVITYLDSVQVLTNCILVCRQWFDIIMTRIKFNFRISERREWKKLSQSHQKYIDRVECLHLKYNLLIFTIIQKRFYNLRELDLSGQNCYREGVKCLKSLKHLTVLNVSKTKCANGVKYIGMIENLTSLNISSVHLENQDVEHLSSLKKLTSLDVNNCNLTFEDADIISRLKSLTFLDIGNNDLGPLGLLPISSMESLQTLHINRIWIESESCESLTKMINLTELYISKNDFGNEGLKWISSMKNLRVLDIGNHSIIDALGDEAAKLVASLTQLTYLNISQHEITSSGAKYLTSLTKLTTLFIDGNEICDDFLDSISSLKELTYLNISGGQISVKGVKSISKLPRLTILDISECVGCCSEVLKQLGLMKQLTSLHLSLTDLVESVEGFKYWHKNLINLTYLEMNFCGLDDNAIKWISGLPNLKYLDLQSNDLTDDCIQHLLGMKKLEYLSLFGNNMTEKKTKRLEKYLKKVAHNSDN